MAEFFRRLLAGAEMKAVPLEVLRIFKTGARRWRMNQIAKLAHISGNVPRARWRGLQRNRKNRRTVGAPDVMAVLEVYAIRSRMDDRIKYAQPEKLLRI
ncbi:MAG: hypothetical protein ACLRZH_19145 [Ruthenibacterium lactatiformans]